MIGALVPGRHDEWFFVERDLYDIARQVQEYDPSSRLVYSPEMGAHGIAVHMRSEPDFPASGYWYIALVHTDPASGEPIQGPADQRICRLQRRADAHRRNMRLGRRLRRASELQEHRRNWLAEEVGGQGAEEYVHRYKKHMGQQHHAYIPASV